MSKLPSATNPLRMLAALFIGLLALWVWRQSYTSSCLALLIPFACFALITLYARDIALQRRRCWVRCHLRSDHALARWLGNVHMATVIAMLSALVSTLALFASIALWNNTLIWLLALDGLFLLGLFIGLQALGKPILQATSVRIISKRWAVALNTLLVLIGLMLVQLYSPFPSHLQSDLLGSIQAASGDISCQCTVISNWLRLATELDSVGWWLMQQGNLFLPTGWPRILAWGLFLLSGSLSAWAYSRFLIQLLDMSRDAASQ